MSTQEVMTVEPSRPLLRSWSTCDVPDDSAVDYWRDAQRDAYVAVTTDPISDRFTGEIQLGEYADFRLSTKKAAAEEVRRDRRTIARGTENLEYLYVVFPVRGDYLVEQCGNRALVSPGSAVIYDSAIPFTLRAPEAYEQVVLELPAEASLSAAGLHRTDDLLATAFRCTGAMRAVSSFFINLALTQDRDPARTRLLEPNALALGLTMLSLVSPSAHAPDAVLRGEVLAFMRMHFTDPELNAESIAAGIHTSRRTLYRLFEGTGQSITGHLRALRIDSAKNVFVAQRDKPIATVAFELGFSSPMQFYRAFRDAVGLTPGEFRERQHPQSPD